MKGNRQFSLWTVIANSAYGRYSLIAHVYLQGGLKAVIWTDVFQAVIMFAGLFSVLIKVGEIIFFTKFKTDYFI